MAKTTTLVTCDNITGEAHAISSKFKKLNKRFSAIHKEISRSKLVSKGKALASDNTISSYMRFYRKRRKKCKMRALHPNSIYLRNMFALGCTGGGWGWQNSGSKVGSKHMPLWMHLKRVQVVSETMVRDSCLSWNSTSSHFHHKFRSNRALTNCTWEDAQR